MAYRGTQNGMRIYDFVEDVPDSLAESGQKFIVLYPPQELIENRAMPYKIGNSLDPATWAAIAILITKIIMISIVGIITILVLQQVGYILQGRPGKKVDENLFEGGDGSMWIRDPTTGEWTMAKGPRTDTLLFLIVAIGLIAIAIILFIAYQKGAFKKKSSTGSTEKKSSKPKKKFNPHNPKFGDPKGKVKDLNNFCKDLHRYEIGFNHQWRSWRLKTVAPGELGVYNEQTGSNIEVLSTRIMKPEKIKKTLLHIDKLKPKNVQDYFNKLDEEEKKRVNNPGRPPKKWWDEKVKEVKEGNPDYSEEQIRETVGSIWHNKLSESKKREILKRSEKGSKKKNNPGPGKDIVYKYRVKGYLPGGKGELLFDTREEAETWVQNTGKKIPIKKIKGHYKKERRSSGFLTSREEKVFVEG